jgi:hypothetical protein
MDGENGFNPLEFDNQLAGSDVQVNPLFSDVHTFVLESHGRFTLVINTSELHFVKQGFLIERFEEPEPQLAMHLDVCTDFFM